MTQYIVLKQYHDESYSSMSNLDHLLTEVEAIAVRDMMKRTDPDHEYIIFQISK